MWSVLASSLKFNDIAAPCVASSILWSVLASSLKYDDIAGPCVTSTVMWSAAAPLKDSVGFRIVRTGGTDGC
jgi:hypothetical protein